MEREEYEKMHQLEERHWYFAGKRRLVLSLLERFAGTTRLPLLDAGCGTGATLAELSARHDAIGLEPFGEALAWMARTPGLRLVQGVLEQLPFRSESFAAVTALDVLEHCDDDGRALTEIRRVLRPGGLLVLTVPALMLLWSSHDVALHHRRRYTLSGLCSLLERNGFSVCRASYFNFFVFAPVALFRLLERLKGAGQTGSDTERMPMAPVNTLMNLLQGLERVLIRFMRLPVGVSLVVVARPVAEEVSTP